MSKGEGRVCVWTCVVCVGGSEGHVDSITGVPRTGRLGSPRQGTLTTTAGTPSMAQFSVEPKSSCRG